MKSLISLHKLASDRLQTARTTLYHLAGLIKEDGEFVYKYDYDTRAHYGGYNILRHCGCIWALNYAKTEEIGANLSESVLRSLAWLFETYSRVTPGGEVCVGTEKKVKLGGSALAVVALATLSAIDMKQYYQHIKNLCEYIAGQWCDDTNDFIHCRTLPSWEANDFRSNYYTGQALFALLLAEEVGVGRTSESRALNWTRDLAKQGYGVPAQSHWMMYAVSSGLRREIAVDLLGYAIEFVDGIFSDSSYRDREECTPIACRSEALAQFVAIASLMGNRWEYARVRHAVETIEENIELQLKNYRSDGAFVCGGGKTYVRIDFLQHNAIALTEIARSLSRYVTTL